MNNPDKMNILIVDDHALTRFGLRTALQAKSNIHKITEAESGEKGVELSKKLKPDIVIMDIGLPGINGIETSRQIKNIDKNIKIIILTSYDNEDYVLESIHAGAQAYCLKNIEPEKLMNVIDFISQGAIWFDSGIAKNVLNLIKNSKMRESSNSNGKKEIPQLTERELDVLGLIVDGYSNAEISEKLCVSIHTTKAHVCNILHKLSVEDRTQAAIKALRDKII